MAFAWLLLGVLFSSSEAMEIDLLECQPPDLPVWGGYGPVRIYYMPGDVIHYFCDVDTYIGGNFYRKCEDTGVWSGDTPVCDAPTAFRSNTQTSDLDDDSGSQKAVDGIRTTCTETIGGEREEWSGTFDLPGELIRVMLFLPRGPASFEVVLVKQNGDEVICGRQSRNIDRYDWLIQNCPEFNNGGAVGLKIRSLTTDALKICEIQAHVLTSPKCKDPRYPIEDGRLRLTRKTATLVCEKGFTRSPEAKLECVREGEWNRKTLLCLVVKCEPPNLPLYGGFGPVKVHYYLGDVIHYFCDVDTHIAGNFIRRCQDNGQWSGQMPLCDDPIDYSSTTQSSDKDDKSTSYLAVDGQRSTCSETAEGERGVWVGNFSQPGKLLRFMMFIPTGPTSYGVIIVKETGEEIPCISTENRENHGWIYYTCPASNDVDDIGIKIRSLSLEPLKICEIATYVLTSPKCDDPHIHIENGHLVISRKTAVLECDNGFYNGQDDSLDCIEDGHWDNKNLSCHGRITEPRWETNNEDHLGIRSFELIREKPSKIKV